MSRYCPFILLLVTLLSGCASVSQTLGSGPAPSGGYGKFYAGVRTDASLLSECHFSLGEKCAVLTPLALVDLPLSAIVDTLFLPYTMFTLDLSETDRN